MLGNKKCAVTKILQKAINHSGSIKIAHAQVKMFDSLFTAHCSLLSENTVECNYELFRFAKYENVAKALSNQDLIQSQLQQQQ